MLPHDQRVLAVKSRASRGKAHLRRRPGRRLWVPEGLENRLLLSGGPTMYTVNSTHGGVSGTGDSGTLAYVIGLANNDPNTAGSEIHFALPSSGSPQTIALSSTLVLSEKAGPEMIDGPGASLVTVSGNNAVEVFSVGQRRNGQPERAYHRKRPGLSGRRALCRRRDGLAHERECDQQPSCGRRRGGGHYGFGSRRRRC